MGTDTPEYEAADYPVRKRNDAPVRRSGTT